MTRNQADPRRERSIDSVHFDRCAQCGASLETGEWQPVETIRMRGTVRVRAFCDESCCEEFLE